MLIGDLIVLQAIHISKDLMHLHEAVVMTIHNEATILTEIRLTTVSSFQIQREL